ncbi:MAG TPA: CDP-alcohol phosphatidyltransferase family protein [Candidatus Nanoarchaeia archaeon]|nr:CDP-alcohol phosphatidyltransferase family protein [Candidatus Nanoarchaeia archaeon]
MKKVPPAKELEKICFTSKPDIYRKISIHFTRIALMFGCRANHITALRVIFLIAGITSFIKGMPLTGVIFYQLALLLDTMDGAIARYNKEASFLGEAMDLMLDHISSTVVYFISLGVLAYSTLGIKAFYISIATIILAQIAAFFRALYVEHNIFVEKIKKENRLLRFFHQDNMRFLLLILTLAVIANFWQPNIIEIALYFNLAFIALKTAYLFSYLWITAKKFPNISAAIAYMAGAICIIFLMRKAKWARDFLQKHFSDVKIIKTLLEISK